MNVSKTIVIKKETDLTLCRIVLFKTLIKSVLRIETSLLQVSTDLDEEGGWRPQWTVVHFPY